MSISKSVIVIVPHIQSLKGFQVRQDIRCLEFYCKITFMNLTYTDYCLSNLLSVLSVVIELVMTCKCMRFA